LLSSPLCRKYPQRDYCLLDPRFFLQGAAEASFMSSALRLSSSRIMSVGKDIDVYFTAMRVHLQGNQRVIIFCEGLLIRICTVSVSALVILISTCPRLNLDLTAFVYHFRNKIEGAV
jgi:hypothetical protein